jgi:uncharacterized protein YeaO (DUF488 family)
MRAMRRSGTASAARKGRGKAGATRGPRPAARAAIRIKRVYESRAPEDGLRILVDRLWPRGMSKAKLRLDAWPRQLAPSTGLRRWYAHDPQRWKEFRRRYLDELKQSRDALAQLRATLRGRKATLLTATRELELSHAEVLRRMLSGRR